VLNKYVSETEKNVRRPFDAADSADVILFVAQGRGRPRRTGTCGASCVDARGEPEKDCMMARRAKNVFESRGRVIDEKTRCGLDGLRVEAWDKDLMVNELLGLGGHPKPSFDRHLKSGI